MNFFLSIVLLLTSLSLYSVIPPADLQKIAPCLMPDDHPIKASLDDFFSEKRWTFSPKTMKEGGFSSSKPRQFSHIVVASHPQFPGYLFKVSLDVQRLPTDKKDYFLWKKRVDGIEKIRTFVNSMGWQQTFALPRKWIYLLPEYPKCPQKGYVPKVSILVVEDVDLLPADQNKAYWSSSNITYEMLDRLYVTLKTTQMNDCTIITNIPITKNGTIGFIDTQIWGSNDINWYYLNKALSADNRLYWKKITKQK